MKPAGNNIKRTSIQGYSLAESVISLSIIAILSIGTISILDRQQSTKASIQTKERLAFIEQSIKNFSAQHQRLPCPADPSIQQGENNFGQEVDFEDSTVDLTITGGCRSDNNIITPDNNAGAVPVATLGIPYYYSFDGWGQKFTYRIDGNAAANQSLTKANLQGNLTITDIAGNTKAAANNLSNQEGALFVLISYGENGTDIAWQQNIDYNALDCGSLIPSQNCPQQATGIESTNSDHNRAFYIQDVRSEKFDDMITFTSRDQLASTKRIESPVKPRNITCQNAKTIAESGTLRFISETPLTPQSSDTFLIDTNHVLKDYAGSQFTTRETALNIYQAATTIAYLCDNNWKLRQPLSFHPVLWLDASNRDFLYQYTDCSSGYTGGGVINSAILGCWSDLSNKQNHATQTSQTNQPSYISGGILKNNLGQITFDLDKHYTLNNQPIIGTTARTLVTAFHLDNTSSNPQGLFSLDKSGGNGHEYNVNIDSTSQTLNISLGTSLASFPVDMSILTDNFYDILVIQNAEDATLGEVTAFLNGTELTQTTNSNTQINTSNGSESSATWIGADGTNSLEGTISEIIMFDQKLAHSQRRDVEQYLAKRWNSKLSNPRIQCPHNMHLSQLEQDPIGDCHCANNIENDRTPDYLKTSLADNKDNVCYIQIQNDDFASCNARHDINYSAHSIQEENFLRDLRLWLDASDCSTIQANDSNVVSQWNGKSIRQTITIANGSPTYIPTSSAFNGKPAIEFDTGDKLTLRDSDNNNNTYPLSDEEARSLFFVLNRENIHKNQIFFTLNDKNSLANAYNINTIFGLDGGGNIKLEDDIATGTGSYLLVISQNAYTGINMVTLRVNGIDVGTTTSGSFQMLNSSNSGSAYIGQHFNGHIAEILIYGRAFGEMVHANQLEDYLLDKWGGSSSPKTTSPW